MNEIEKMYENAAVNLQKMSKYNFEQKRNDYETPPDLVNRALEIVSKKKL